MNITKEEMVNITIYSSAEKNRWYNPESKVADEMEEYKINHNTFKNTWDDDQIIISEQEVVVKLKGGINLSTGQLEVLKNKRAALTDAYVDKKAFIDSQIDDLLALEYESEKEHE
jgi:hypothetical protein